MNRSPDPVPIAQILSQSFGAVLKRELLILNRKNFHGFSLTFLLLSANIVEQQLHYLRMSTHREDHAASS